MPTSRHDRESVAAWRRAKKVLSELANFVAPRGGKVQTCHSRTRGVVNDGNGDFVARWGIQLFRGIVD